MKKKPIPEDFNTTEEQINELYSKIPKLRGRFESYKGIGCLIFGPVGIYFGFVLSSDFAVEYGVFLSIIGIIIGAYIFSGPVIYFLGKLETKRLDELEKS